jgi:hypothetical protein
LPKDHTKKNNEAVARSAMPSRASQNSDRRKEMNTLLKRFGSKRSFGMMALRGLAALVGSALALGQEAV